MNKYSDTVVITKERYKELLKLEDRATPMKPINNGKCPKCDTEAYYDTGYGTITHKHCTWCGQALDWSEDNE